VFEAKESLNRKRKMRLDALIIFLIE
jgi:hypothetical protein